MVSNAHRLAFGSGMEIFFLNVYFELIEYKNMRSCGLDTRSSDFGCGLQNERCTLKP